MKARIGIAASIAAILLATLHTSGSELADGWTWTLTSGESALAELIQNLLLFIPLGLSLTLAGVPLLRTVAIGAGLSFSVEFLQQWIGGRDPTVGDLVNNTVSTALGAGLTRLAPRWLLTPPDRSAWHALGTAVIAVLTWFGTAALLRSTFPPPPYYVIPKPDYHAWGHYRGEIRSARLERAMLIVEAVAPARWPGRISPLAAVLDAQGTRATILAVDGPDLSLRYHMPAVRLTLEQPDLRWRGALATIAPGDTFSAATGRDRGSVCLALNRDWRCGLGYTIGDGWRLIFDPQAWPAWMLTLINACWVAGCVIGVGYWAARTTTGDKPTVEKTTGDKTTGDKTTGDKTTVDKTTVDKTTVGTTTVRDGRGRYGTVMAKAAVALVLIGLILVPAVTELNATRLVEWIGALLGIEAGLILGGRSWNDAIDRSA